jgi:hypothetical protein
MRLIMTNATQYQAPVVIVQPPRDCMLVDGHRYCRDEDVTPRQVGFILIGVVLFFAWALLPITVLEDALSFRAKVACYVVPFLALASWLVLQ